MRSQPVRASAKKKIVPNQLGTHMWLTKFSKPSNGVSINTHPPNSSDTSQENLIDLTTKVEPKQFHKQSMGALKDQGANHSSRLKQTKFASLNFVNSQDQECERSLTKVVSTTREDKENAGSVANLLQTAKKEEMNGNYETSINLNSIAKDRTSSKCEKAKLASKIEELVSCVCYVAAPSHVLPRSLIYFRLAKAVLLFMTVILLPIISSHTVTEHGMSRKMFSRSYLSINLRGFFGCGRYLIIRKTYV
jgi:hypothetical protein